MSTGMIEEEEEEEEELRDESEQSGEEEGGWRQQPMSEAPVAFKFEDIPQAFTHFTFERSRRKMMVCDLQGALDTASSPAVFELTDPVIHYNSSSGRKNVYGRSDGGLQGIHKFFSTHICSELCKAVRKTWIRPSVLGQPGPTAAGASKKAAGRKAKNSSCAQS